MKLQEGTLVDRKNRTIGEGDFLAFDIPVFMGAGAQKAKMWDIYWGRAVSDGIQVEFCPITQRENVIYEYPDDPLELLIIRRHTPKLDPSHSDIAEQATARMQRDRDENGDQLSHQHETEE